MGLFSSIFNKNNKKKDNQMEFNIEEFVDDLIQKSDLYEIGDMNIGIEEEKKEALTPHNQSNYQLPPLEFLDKPEKRSYTGNDVIETNINKIEELLRVFNISAKVIGVHIGPAVTQYELEIENGIKLSKVTEISREIATVFKKNDVIIEAPIPGKNTIGIEIANDTSDTVSFYEAMMSKEMIQESNNNEIKIPLGKDINGNVGIYEVNKMSHLLIVGTTGSGKSVCINEIICSILMKNKPNEVKLAMVDTKVVELSVYNGIPHLICPVVSEPKQATILIKKLANEMEKRYYMFAQTGTKNIEAYNEYVEKWNQKNPNEQLEKMPTIITIIDDLSDLLNMYKQEVEKSLLSMTKKGTIAGIHLIVSTQILTKEIMSDTLKVSIPSKIAFSVNSADISRKIINQTGAEKLLGRGDMLFLPQGTYQPIRLQGTFIHDDEVNKIIEFIKLQEEASYIEEFMKYDNEVIFTHKNKSDDDKLYDQIVYFTVENQKVSASLLQRKFKIGYNKAANMIDLMEANGIVGPATGNSKPRDVLVEFKDE